MMSQPSTTLARSPRLVSAFDPVVAIVAALTAIGLALRAVGSNSQLWYDEIYSLVVSSRPPLHELLTTYYGDIQHPLYSVLANLSVSALGETAWTVRLPAIIFGVASIPLLFLLGRAVATTHEALLASALLTVSYHHVWFSQNARGYTLLLFLTLLCTLLFYRGLQLRRWPPFLCYAVAAALGAYTHLTFVFVVVSHAASVLLLAAPTFRTRRPGQGPGWLAMPIAAIILSGVLTLVFYSPMLSQVIDYYLHVSGKMKALSTPTWALLETLRGLQLGFGSQLVVGCRRALCRVRPLGLLEREPARVLPPCHAGDRHRPGSGRRARQAVPALPVPPGWLRHPDRGAGRRWCSAPSRRGSLTSARAASSLKRSESRASWCWSPHRLRRSAGSTAVPSRISPAQCSLSSRSGKRPSPS